MNSSATSRNTLRFWAPTGIAGTVATAAVVLLTSTVAMTPAYSSPRDQQPVEPGLADTSDAGLVPHYCFMGRDSWPDDLVPMPFCGR